MFGSVASGPALPRVAPTSTPHSLQDLQDLAMMGFGDSKRSIVIFSTVLYKQILENSTSGTDYGILNVTFSLSSQTMRGSSFGMPVAAPAAVPAQGSPSSASFLQGTVLGSPALPLSLGSAPGSPLFRSLSPCRLPLQGSPTRAADVPLSNVHVPLEAIRPSEGRQAWLIHGLMINMIKIYN